MVSNRGQAIIAGFKYSQIPDWMRICPDARAPFPLGHDTSVTMKISQAISVVLDVSGRLGVSHSMSLRFHR